MKIIKSRYGTGTVNDEGEEVTTRRGKISLWWRDIHSIEWRNDNLRNWFLKGLVHKVGNGRSVSFWNEYWRGNQKLKDTFRSLYSIVLNKNAKIADLVSGLLPEWEWGFEWRRELYSWEESELTNLKNTIISSLCLQDKEDYWSWKPKPSQGYTAKSAYQLLLKKKWEGESRLEEEELRFLTMLWKMKAPFRVQILVWQLLQGRLPTKVNLAARKIIHEEQGTKCVFCEKHQETENHLFFSCNFAYKVWMKIMFWLRFQFVLSELCHVNLMAFKLCLPWKKNMDSRGYIIWLATVWQLWLTRNNLNFRKESVDIDSVLEAIKRCSWEWFKTYADNSALGLSFSSWCLEPTSCLLQWK
jgi:hypothetical protein